MIETLPADLTDLEAMGRLNRALHAGSARLDWSSVRRASDAALAALLAGLDLSTHADAIGIETVPDAIAEAVEAACSVGTRPKTTRAATSATDGAGPGVWKPGSDPAPAPRGKAPARPKKSASSTSGSRAAVAPRRPSAAPPPATSAEVREHLVRAIEADLVGPTFQGTGSDGGEELLELPPSRWYLTGFLAPVGDREVEDPTNDEELGSGDEEDEPDETAGQEPEPKRRVPLPASIGLSVLLSPGAAEDTIRVTVSYADYELDDGPASTADPKLSSARARYRWRRVPRTPAPFDVPLDASTLARGIEVPDSRGISVEGHIEAATTRGLPKGTRALSLFLVNRRPAGSAGERDAQFIFQVGLEIRFQDGLVARPNFRDEASDDEDERALDLQFQDRMEFAVGHGVAVEPLWDEGSGEHARPAVTIGARTVWIPRSTVRRVVTRDVPGVVVGMEALGAVADGPALRQSIGPLVQAYTTWIGQQGKRDPGTQRRRETRAALIEKARHAAKRIEDGIALLERDPETLAAFRLANQAMALAARKRSPERYEGGNQPEWRLFQLAFVLLSLPGLVDASHADREVVDLIFFPTGGGKTEAYLGVIAIVLILRRMRGVDRPDRGLGVAVLLRYTLRLLTLDQLSRAATLMCALEMLRREDPTRLGEERFSVGLWVGRSATANTFEDVSRRILEYKNSTSRSAPSPFPLTNCPWCNTPLTKDSLSLVPKNKPTDVVVGCASFRCEFSAGRNKEGLPVLFVDEQVYRELPAFVVATVDKFAMLPWRGETGKLFGRVHSRTGRVFEGPVDSPKPAPLSVVLPEGLRPPELIVQDELHLISGPLGTMVGLYETAIDALSTHRSDGHAFRPKVLASTATARRAKEQIRSLFGRTEVAVFPPAGVEDAETFFARVDREGPGRDYIGVAASGRALKAILLRTYSALLGGAAHRFDTAGAPLQPADPYMTIAGYFNSLRELGGMRRLVEDEVRNRVGRISARRPENLKGSHPWFADRAIQAEPVELTSRESTFRIAEAKARIALHHLDPKHVDVVLASNMISVGIDIERLGLMVVAGQPKSTSEYIQATSRVGRDPSRPGLVVTVFNVHRPRDRSHYERFGAYHGCFYRFVEATSVTPFSGPALERGLAGVLVALTRLANVALTPSDAVMNLPERRKAGEAAVAQIADRAGKERDMTETARGDIVAALTSRGLNLLDAWTRVVGSSREAAAERCYSRFDRPRSGKPLLFQVIEEDKPVTGSDEAKFAAPTSMRDVEPSVHLWIQRGGFAKGPRHGA